jgi:ribosomal protein S1
VIVIVEDFLKEMNSFIVSHKRYLAHIIPIKIQELDLNKKYSGLVTGCSKYGIFVEFEELFTGLLHTSKMDESTKSLFFNRSIKAGDVIDFYIGELTKDNRIILTNESPEEKLKKIQDFIFNVADKVVEASVVAVMNFGVLVEVSDIKLTGLVPISDFKRNRIMASNYLSGDKINIIFDQYKDDKLVFKLAVHKNESASKTVKEL